MNVVGISGALTTWSRTAALLQFVAKQAAADSCAAIDLIGIGDLSHELASTPARTNAPPGLDAVLERIEAADLLIVGTPISNGSYTGLLKHLFDLVIPRNAANRAAIIVATHPGDCNSLTLEKTFHPLLKLLGYHAVSTVVYARHDDFVDLGLMDDAVSARAQRAVREAFASIVSKPHSLPSDFLKHDKQCVFVRQHAAGPKTPRKIRNNPQPDRVRLSKRG